MKNRKIIYSFLAILLVFNLIFWGMIASRKNLRTQVVFLDVGQGDSILISRGASQILIDGGPSSQKILEKLGRYVPFWDRRIEVVMATHPDQDHIGGLVGVFQNYSVGKLIESPARSDSNVFQNLSAIVEEKGVEKIIGEKGLRVVLGDVPLEIVFPESGNSVDSRDTNVVSLVGKLSFGKSTFLFTGDLPDEKEKELAGSDTNISSNVLKVSHHGSKYATTQEFLEKVHPQEAVISVGEKNRYGHPSAEVLERLQKENIAVFRTDQLGDIAYECQEESQRCFREE